MKVHDIKNINSLIAGGILKLSLDVDVQRSLCEIVANILLKHFVDSSNSFFV